MLDTTLSSWYNEKAVWRNPGYKSKIIQLLYDLNDVNFDLIGKNNYELDINWPASQLVNAKSPSTASRVRRTSSVSSYSIGQSTLPNDKELVSETTTPPRPIKRFIRNVKSDTHSCLLLGSTPLQMDDLIMGQVVSDHQQHTILSAEADKDRDDVSHPADVPHSTLVNELREQLRCLTEQLSMRTQENADLNSCLVRQTILGENLSSMLRTADDKTKSLEAALEKNSTGMSQLKESNGAS